VVSTQVSRNVSVVLGTNWTVNGIFPQAIVPGARTTCSDAAANAHPPRTNARINTVFKNFFTAQPP
jgi:hypothetical protein